MGPYQDKQGIFWIKAGADKRKAASREEILRQFQKNGMLYAEKTLVPKITIQDIDTEYFEWFYNKVHSMPFKDSGISLEQAVNNMGLAEKQTMNMCGALFLAKNTKLMLPLCRIKAVHFAGYTIDEDHYLDSREITGRIDDQLKKTVSFFVDNMRMLQIGDNFNTPGTPEIPVDVLSELTVNALVHRDFFINAVIRILMFRDRIEIISPGTLTNNLTLEMIKAILKRKEVKE
jgi:ATP-dependent DNA helicase RecG